MTKYILPPIAHHFITITDPRVEKSSSHKLIDIIMLAICAVISGADTWVDSEDFGKEKRAWFKTFLEPKV